MPIEPKKCTRRKVTAPLDSKTSWNLAEALELYLSDCRARNLTQKTLTDGIGYCCGKLVAHFGPNESLVKVTPDSLRSFMIVCNENYLPRTTHTIFIKNKTWFEFLKKGQYIPENPFDQLKNVRVEKRILPFLNEDEVKTVVDTIKKPNTILELRDCLIMFLSIECGIRLSEMASLRRSDIDGIQVTINRGKMGFGRSVVMGEATSRMMREYLVLLDKLDVNDVLWISVNGKPLTRHGIRFVFERFSKLLKPHNLKVSSHKMRRTSARSYIENNVNSQIICSIFGWHSYSMIDLYAKSSSRAVENAIKDTSLIDSIISLKSQKTNLIQIRK